MPERPCVGDGNTSPVRASSTDGPGIDGGGLRDTRHARGLPRAGRGQTHSARPSRPRHEHVAYLDAPPSRLPRGHMALRRAHAAWTRGTPPSSRSVPGLGHNQAARYVLWHLEDVGLLPPRVLLPGGDGCGPGIPGPWRTPDSMSPTVAPGHGAGKRCLRCRGYAQKSKWGRGTRHHRS